MNRRGQTIIGFLFGVLVFVIIWALALGKWLAEWGAFTVEHNDLVGFEAFFYMNLNLLVLLCLVMSLFWVAYRGSSA